MALSAQIGYIMPRLSSKLITVNLFTAFL